MKSKAPTVTQASRIDSSSTSASVHYTAARCRKRPSLRWVSSLEQRDADTEETETHSNGEMNETDDTDESSSGKCILTFQDAAKLALRKEFTDTPDLIFVAARALKRFEQDSKQRIRREGIGSFFSLWWNLARERGLLPKDADFEKFRILFMNALTKAKTPLGQNVLEVAIETAKKASPPPETTRYSDSPQLYLLTRVCCRLQAMQGSDTFFLSVRDAARIMNESSPRIGQAYLNGLVEDGFMNLVKKGTIGKASRYRIVPACSKSKEAA